MKKNLTCKDFEERLDLNGQCKEIIDLVENNSEIELRTVDLSNNMESRLELILAVILKRYEHDHLVSALYTSLKEILVNATRANAKVAFFKEENLDINNHADFVRGTELMKSRISESWIQEYGNKATKDGHDTKIKISYNEQGIRIVVENVALKPEEEARIREKLSLGMKYNDLMAFYMDHADQTEGEGMGLAMILVLLKGENIDPNLFRMGIVGDKTMSRLEIPFSEDFKSVRGKNPAGAKVG